MFIQIRTTLIDGLKQNDVVDPSPDHQSSSRLTQRLVEYLQTISTCQENHHSVVRHCCEGAVWDISSHPLKHLLEVRRLNNGVKSSYDVMMKRPKEFPVDIRVEKGGINNEEIKMFDCEYLWKSTRYCVGKELRLILLLDSYRRMS